MCKLVDDDVNEPLEFAALRIRDKAALPKNAVIKWLIEQKADIRPNQPILVVLFGGECVGVICSQFSGSLCSPKVADGDKVPEDGVLAVLRPEKYGPCQGNCKYTRLYDVFVSINYSTQYNINRFSLEKNEEQLLEDYNDPMNPKPDEDIQTLVAIADEIKRVTLQIDSTLENDIADAKAAAQRRRKAMAEIRREQKHISEMLQSS